MNNFLSWLAVNNLSGWYFITLEQIFNFKEGESLELYLKDLNPITENPFNHQCENNTWLLVNKDVQPKPIFPIDWCIVSDKWDIFKAENKL